MLRFTDFGQSYGAIDSNGAGVFTVFDATAGGNEENLIGRIIRVIAFGITDFGSANLPTGTVDYNSQPLIIIDGTVDLLSIYTEYLRGVEADGAGNLYETIKVDSNTLIELNITSAGQHDAAWVFKYWISELTEVI